MDTLRPRTCRECGNSFPGGPRAWYCPRCREARRKDRESQYRKDGPKRTLGSTDLCTVCGGEYIVKSGRQRYCPGCAFDAVKKVDNRQGKEWYQANADTYNPARYARRNKDRRVCVICGNVFSGDGTKRNTCSEECRHIQKKQAQKRADAKRRPKKRKAEEP